MRLLKPRSYLRLVVQAVAFNVYRQRVGCSKSCTLFKSWTITRGPLFLAVLCFLPNIAVAETLWTVPASQCEPAGNVMSALNSTSEVFVYVENDFADEMTACTPWVTDDGLYAEYEAHARIEEAIEIWNQESRSVSLHFEGTVPTGDIATACNSYMPKRPAIIVTLQEGCQVDGAGQCETNVLAHAEAYSSDCAYVRFYGSTTSPTSCNGVGPNWSLKNDSSGWPITSVLAHEVAHTIGLGHSNEPDNNRTSSAIMARGLTRRLHAWSWDKDCVRFVNDANSDGRYVDYKYMWWGTGTGNGYFATSTHPYATQRGIISGGALDDYYGLFSTFGDWIDYTVRPSAYTTTTFNLSTQGSNLADVHVSPTFWSPYGSRPYSHHAFVVDEGVPGSPATDYQPPRLNQVRSNNMFSTSNSGHLRYRTGASTAYVQTNLPPSVAYDPRSGNVVVAWVDTTFSSTTNGQINVHAGFSSTRILNEGDVLSSSNTSIGSAGHPTGLDYELETDRVVGLACGDDLWFDYGGKSFNCLLAWQDRGTPWGRVLYTYFRVDAGNTITWLQTAYVRGGSRASGGVSAAYSNSNFRMTWKKWLGGNAVVTTQTGSYTGWTVNGRYVHLDESATQFQAA